MMCGGCLVTKPLKSTAKGEATAAPIVYLGKVTWSGYINTVTGDILYFWKWHVGLGHHMIRNSSKVCGGGGLPQEIHTGMQL